MLIVWKEWVVVLGHSIVFTIQALNEILNQACQVVWLRHEIPSFRLVNTHLLAWKSRVLSPPSHKQICPFQLPPAKPLCWTCGWWCGRDDGLGCGAGCATPGVPSCLQSILQTIPALSLCSRSSLPCQAGLQARWQGRQGRRAICCTQRRRKIEAP